VGRVQARVTLLLAVCALGTPATATATAAPATSARVYLTTPGDGKTLQRQSDVHFTSSPPSSESQVVVTPSQRYQRMRGFGAAFTDSSLSLLAKLPDATRHEVLEKLLDPQNGIGLSVMRVPMGASDFSASGVYSYDDLPAGQTDPTLSHFSIAHDEAYVLPILREALAINPKLKLIANPWSAPAWMKTNSSMFGVAVPGGPGTLNPSDYGPLAQYFVKFIGAYRAAGVPIWAVTPQNEPLQPTADYPGMFLTPTQEADVVHNYLKPALRSAHLGGVKVYGFDYVWLGSESYVPPLMAQAGSDLAGIAYHCYFGAPESMSAMHALYPGADTIEDECSTGISLLSPVQVLIRSANNWASTVLMWNAALDPSGGPKMGSGCVNCIGMTTVDPSSGKVSYTGDYWQIGQASKFVQRGARRVAVSVTPDTPVHGNAPVGGIEATGFRNPDGSVVVVATASGPPITFTLSRPDGKGFTYSLPQDDGPNGTDNSEDAPVVTFVWGGRQR
jgi:glucosylceramidase